MARRTKCTPELIQEITGYIAKGATNHDACVMSGISQAAFYNWIVRAEAEEERVSGNNGRRVRKAEQPYIEFMEAVKKAQTARKLAHIENINRHAMTSWQASAWWLERRYPNEYGRRERVEHTGKDGEKLEIVVTYAKDRVDAA